MKNSLIIIIFLLCIQYLLRAKPPIKGFPSKPFSYSFIAYSPEIFSPSNIAYSGLRGTGQLSLTFDDGPAVSGSTLSILKTLKLYNDHHFNIKATFFVLGKLSISKKSKTLLKLMQEDGHIVANHTRNHPNLKKASFSDAKALFSEILNTHQIIKSFLPTMDDLGKRWYFRAPYGAWHSQRASILNNHPVTKNYIGPIFWDIGGDLSYKNGQIFSAADWACWGKKKLSISQCALGYLRESRRKNGGVVLFHDIHSKTAEMLKYLLVAWTGVNLFDDPKYSEHIDVMKTAMNFVSLDDIKAYDQYDKRQ